MNTVNSLLKFCAIPPALLALAAAPIAAQAQTTVSKSGFYLGAGAGVASFNNKKTTTTPMESHELGATDFVGGGFAGYGFDLDSGFNLAVEAFINGATVEARVFHNQEGKVLTTAYKYSYGARVLPGYQFTDTTAGHVVLGYAKGNFKIADTGSYGLVNHSFGVNGFQVGIGGAVALSDNLSLRGDALYTLYAKKDSKGFALAKNGGELDTYTNDISTFEALVSLVYSFS